MGAQAGHIQALGRSYPDPGRLKPDPGGFKLGRMDGGKENSPCFRRADLVSSVAEVMRQILLFVVFLCSESRCLWLKTRK